MVFLTDFTRPQRDVLVTLSLVGMTSALYQTVILPFVAFFIVDTGVCDNLFDPGYYASFVTGAGHVGRMFTSFAWGRYSDRHGRVPVIKLALVAIAASSTLLSWTLSFRLAILCRFVCGALDPTWSMVKVLAAELLPKERQAAAMSSLGASYGMAMLLGPAIGGILARPATEYPMLRIPPDAMLAHRPYFLPNIMIVAIALATLMVTGSVLHDAPSQKSDSLLLSSSSHPPNKGYGALPEQRHESDCCSAFCCTRKPALATAFYALISCVEFTEDLVFPLWAAAPRSVHGLALTSSQIGLLLAIAGAAVVPGQLLFYPSVDRRLTTLGVMRLGCVVTATLTALMPLAAVGNNSTWMWSCLCATKVLRLSVAEFVFSAQGIVSNNAVRVEDRGAFLGVQQMICSLARIVGPLFVAPFFAWTLQNPPFNYSFSFIIVAFLNAAAAIVSYIMPTSIGKPIEDGDAEVSVSTKIFSTFTPPQSPTCTDRASLSLTTSALGCQH